MIEVQTTPVRTSAADRKRAKLERNQAKAKLRPEPELSASDIRQFDKAVAKRADVRLTLTQRQRAASEVIAVEQRLKTKRELHWRDAAVGETVALAEAQGAVVRRRADGGAQRELGAGLGVLWTAKRLTVDQMQAGKRYGDDFAQAGASMRSCLDDSSGSGAESAGLPPRLQDATFELERARKRGLFGEQAMIKVCDDVCGRGLKVTELAPKHADGKADSRQAAVLEERLRCALNLLSLHYGLAPELRAS